MSNGLFHKDKYIFHITHIKNLPAILKKGILSKNKISLENIKYTNIAYNDIQQARALIKIPGTEYTLHDCVPLFFGARPPMLYAIKGKGVAQEEILYLVVDWDVINDKKTWFTDGNARAGGTKFYQGVEHIQNIDFEAADAYFWHNRGDDFRRKKQAEILRLDCITLERVQGIVVYNDKAKTEVEKILKNQGINMDVVIVRGFYYQ